MKIRHELSIFGHWERQFVFPTHYTARDTQMRLIGSPARISYTNWIDTTNGRQTEYSFNTDHSCTNSDETGFQVFSQTCRRIFVRFLAKPASPLHDLSFVSYSAHQTKRTPWRNLFSAAKAAASPLTTRATMEKLLYASSLKHKSPSCFGERIRIATMLARKCVTNTTT